MPISPFDPVTEQTRYQKLLDEQQKEKEVKETLDPAVAQRVAQIYRDAPYIPASVILSMAKSGTSPETVEAIKKTAAVKTAKDLDPQKPKKKGWFQEAIFDNVKAASRWSFAALNLVPDLAQNVASQAFSSNDEAGFDGWFKSTQLGTLMSNTQEAGEGWFLGDTAMEKQAERARRVRGTINGSAWTIGRGAAQVAFTPGSKPYALLSGFVDAAVNIGTDPTLYAGKVIKSTKLAKATIPAVSSQQDIQNASRLARGIAGLDSVEGISFKASDFGKFVLNDPRAQRFTKRLVENATDATKTVEEKTFFILENWKGISPAKAKEFAEAADEAQVLGLLGEASARLSNNTDDLLLSRDIRDIRLGRKTAELSDEAAERSPLFRTIRNSKWFETMPKGSVVINGTGQEKTEAVLTYARYLRGVGLSDETPEFKKAMQQVVAAYSSTNPATARAASKQAYEDTFRIIAKHAGLKSKEQETVVEEIISAARAAASRIYNVDDAGRIDDGGFVQNIRELVGDEAFSDFRPDQLDNLVMSSPSALNELTEEIQVLPDFRKLRALAGNPFLSRGITRSAKTGEQRKIQIIAEYIQQDIWKPLALATGGYAMRNGLDAQTRMAMYGYRSIFTHPQDYILWVLRRKGKFDITGEDFGGYVQKNWNKDQKDFWSALTFDLHKNLKDPMGMERTMLRNESFSLASRTADPFAHTTGYVDNLAQLNDDPINGFLSRLYVAGLTKTERRERIITWLNEPEQKEFLGQLRDYFSSGIEVTDPGKLKKITVPIDQSKLDDVVYEWVDKLSEGKFNNIVRGNENIGIVAAYNRVPITEVAPNGRRVAVEKVTRFANDMEPEDFISGDGDIGSIIALGDGTEGVVLRKVETTRPGIDTFTGRAFEPEEQLIIQPVHAGSAFTKNGLGTDELRALIDDAGDNGELANIVKRAERGSNGEPVLGQKFENARSAFVDFFFVNLYGGLTQRLEKSPVFRQAYYKEVFDSADLLAPNEADNLLRTAQQSADAIGMDINRYLGGKNVYQKLKEQAEKSFPERKILLHGSPTQGLKEINPSVGNRGDTPVAWGWSTDQDNLSVLSKEAYKHATKSGTSGSIYITVADKDSLRSVSSGTGTLSAPPESAQAFASLSPMGVVKEIKIEGKTQDKILELIKNAVSETPISSGPSGTVEQLDTYAKAIALNTTKELLYNATERSNLEDVMRIVIPFGAAWREVLGTYAKAVIEDPTRLRKAQLVVTGGERMDMGIFGGIEGQGFFYKDATTGEYSFNFPLSGAITKLLTGQTAPLQAPLKRVSIGLGVVPSIGPMAQIAASVIIPDTPSADAITKILLPYGPKSSFNIAPMWAARFIEAVQGNTMNLQTVYGNTYIETLRALSASGEYDLSDYNDQEKLYADARRKAQILTGLRALGQFLGPTSPSPEFEIDTLQGDMYGTQLVKEFQKLQNENYDTAVQRFLEIYGNDAILYVSNKTESVAGGLEATDEFGDWERGEGKGLINKYRDVAGFMAPGGDDFSFEVWSRQIEKGLRRRLTDREIVELAQYRVASAQYRELRDKLPDNPTQAQKQWLREWRKKLNQQYPGFPVVAEFNPGEFPGKIEQLGRLVQEPALADNDVAKATRTYLTARRNAIQQYIDAGGSEAGFKTAQSTENLRAWLVGVSKALREEVPEFSRIYDRLLSAEVEE